jgi:hypothetical protein
MKKYNDENKMEDEDILGPKGKMLLEQVIGMF